MGMRVHGKSSTKGEVGFVVLRSPAPKEILCFFLLLQESGPSLGLVCPKSGR
jgi:hypothetical protein